MWVKLLVLVLPLLTKTANPCDISDAVDISDGERFDNGTILKNGVYYEPSNYFENDTVIMGCICNLRICVMKCCPEGEYYDSNRTCAPTDATLDISRITAGDITTYALLTGKCNGPAILLNPANEGDNFTINSEGELLVGRDVITITSDRYCLEYYEDTTVVKAVVCTDQESSTNIHHSIGMIISLPFLVATFTVYACLSDRNVHGNCLMCYVASLAVAYIFLVTILLYPTHLENVSCNVLAYICYIAFLASFFWMNAMCLDLFWAFSGKRGYGGDNKSQLKRFAFFNVYAWGIPFLLLIIVIILNGTMDQNSPIYPGIAYKKCWFSDGLPVFLYFYLIIAIILVINLGCFILTALQIRKVRQDTAMLHRTDSQRHSYDNDRHKFDLYLKLLLAMGINWTMEVISWAVEWQLGSNVPEELFYATDFCNACYGVIIFIIFVCNKEKRRRLRKWYYSITGRPMRAQSMSNSSQTTRITHAAAERTTTNDSALLRDPK